MTLEELKPHLHTLPGHPDWIPYRTTYYNRTWGFCLSHNQFTQLKPGSYRVRIAATLAPGHLTYGECILPGDSDSEVLISAHACHPSLANDNLSSIAVAVELARHLAARPRRHTWRILFAPGTIGALAWLKNNEPRLDRLHAGLVLACLGDPGPSTYKRSRIANAAVDRAMEQVLTDSNAPHALEDFAPTGYDQRQYCSPGFNLPVGSLMRTPNGQFPQYHTSADNLDLVQAPALADSLAKLIAAAHILETNRTYLNRHPKGELQLGQRGLYTTGPALDALLWTLNFSDGRHDLLSIARRSKLSYPLIAEAADKLAKAGILQEHPPSSSPSVS
jgi:aminopeptidase-like protein